MMYSICRKKLRLIFVDWLVKQHKVFEKRESNPIRIKISADGNRHRQNSVEGSSTEEINYKRKDLEAEKTIQGQGFKKELKSRLVLVRPIYEGLLKMVFSRIVIKCMERRKAEGNVGIRDDGMGG